jgi:uncharacterized protein with WD repeat
MTTSDVTYISNREAGNDGCYSADYDTLQLSICAYQVVFTQQKLQMLFTFSEIQEGVSPQYSPSGAYIVSCHNKRVVLRETLTLQIVQLHNCSGQVQSVSWSPDNTCVMAVGQTKTSSWVEIIRTGFGDETASVVTLEMPDISRTAWSPDSRAIVTWHSSSVRVFSIIIMLMIVAV